MQKMEFTEAGQATGLIGELKKKECRLSYGNIWKYEVA
jgi:hypothetical protein